MDHKEDKPFTLGVDIDGKSPSSPRESRAGLLSSRYSFLSYLAVIAVVVVGLVWFELDRRFPLLSPGIYSGRIEGLFGHARVGIYAERSEGSDGLILVVVRSGWYPQRVRLTPVKGLPFFATGAMPVVAVGATGRLKFVGKQLAEGRYGGTVRDSVSRASGRWELRLSSLKVQDFIADPEFLELASLRADLEAATRQADLLEALHEGLQAKVVEISRNLSNQQELNSTAEDRTKRLRTNLVKERRALEQREQEVIELQKQLEVAQRVTAMGRLVALSRESLERDSRWISAVLSEVAQFGEVDPEAVKTAAEIVSLMDETEQEREELQRLERAISQQESGRIGKSQAAEESATFESLWRE